MSSVYSVLFALSFAAISALPREIPNRTICTCSLGITSTLTCTLEKESDYEYVKTYNCGRENFTRVDLKLLGKTKLSSKHLPNVTMSQLTVKGEHLKGVSKDAFAGQERLSLVAIVQSALDKIPAAALKRVRQLESVILAENNIRSIDSSFRNIALKNLILRDNEIYLVNSDAFPPSLHRLSLTNNHIETLNGSLKSLGSLEWLFIQRNRLSSLEGELEGLERLTTLDASWNKINSFYLSPMYLPKLGSINLSHNRIAELGNLRGLNGLVEFDLSFNDLETLTVETFDAGLSSLSSLSLSNNRIRTLDDSVFMNLKSLHALIISYNVIKRIDGKLRGLGSLKILDASHNNIITVDNSFSDLVALEILDLSYNHISDIKDGLSTLSHLKQLNLEMNDIKVINEKTFVSLRSLQVLNMSWNPLRPLNGTIFTPLAKMTSLDLTYNPMIKLDSLLVPGFMNISLPPKDIAVGSTCECERRKHLRLDYTSCGTETIIASKSAVLQANDIRLTCI